MVSPLASRSTSKFIASLAHLTCTILAFGVPIAGAQSACSSDGVPAPRLLQERFISADCEACWGESPLNAARPHSVALDWLVPSAQGDEAPLSAVATRDAQVRLETLGNPPLTSETGLQRDLHSLTKAGTLRVAMGPAVGGYVGASIAWKPSFKTVSQLGTWTAWLALVETVPAGTDGTPVERNLVRNMLTSTWDGRKQLSKKERITFLESRLMSVPAGAQPERLRVVGWVQRVGASGQPQVASVAQSRCVPSQP